MKIVIDKYGREWLKKYGTYTLLNISQLAILNLKKEVVVLLLIFSNVTFAQSSIVAAGNQSETFGETFPIMQQVDTIIEASLSVPKFEVPENPTVKPEPVKKKSLFQIIIEFIKNLIKNVSH